ncbi:MAG: glucose-1-phosphate adenylyltransferase [Candidatus Ancillula trichonymphae]|jgi:glucose-1-phosphate adenylyltransferase|nr:glucose-1-phosphate adenylyltransferase [Candidatus Ancillula trichonymphae]
MNKKVLAVVLAGGEGKRLMPLTKHRAKPAVPFGGTYRLIDFSLSNLVNSGYLQIIVLTQYKSHSLDRHISKTWRMSQLLGNYVSTVPAQQRVSKDWYLGSADAIYQCLNIVEDERPDVVVIVGADSVYRMDLSQMVASHIESGAELTVAGIRQPIASASEFGVIEVDRKRTGYVKEFLEKPENPHGLPDDANRVPVNMGNYVANVPAFVEALNRDHKLPKSETAHDMGADIVPYFVKRGECGFYDFTTNRIPESTEKDENYWQDLGTLDAYYESSMNLIHPVFNLYNSSWPLYTGYIGLPPAKFVHDGSSEKGHVGTAVNSIISPGVIISGGRVSNSVLSPGVRINSYADVNKSILLDNVVVKRHAKIKNTILDKYVLVNRGVEIGYDLEKDLARGFTISKNGVVVVPKGTVIYEDHVVNGDYSFFNK